jgi:hypothetical protein
MMLVSLVVVACSEQKPAPIPQPALPPPAPQVVTEAPTTLIAALQNPAMASPAANRAATIISERLASCWQSRQPIGAPAVALRLGLDRSGAVEAVDVVDRARFAAETDYRAAAKTAILAIFKCSPFALPAESHASWESLILLVTPYYA